MSDGKFLGKLQKFGRKLKESGLGEIAGPVVRAGLGASPIGAAFPVIEAVAKALGKDEDLDVLTQALDEELTPDHRVEILRMKTDLELAQLELERTDRESITARHAADMLSDSDLSKNIRPTMCIALNAAAVIYSYIVLILFIVDYFMGSKVFPAFWQNELAKTALVSLWSAATGYNLFYVGGRTFEKRGSFYAAAQVSGR